jgi:uncharacterized damage-inducible protein DinB
MTNKDALRRLLEYTVWANHRAVRCAVTLSPEEFRRDMGLSHGGLRGTLTHMMSAEWIWLERFKGVSPDRVIDEAEFSDLMSLRDRWTAVEEHRAAWFEALDEEAIRDRIAYRTTAGVEHEAPLWQLIQHVANHASYHRGQVITIIRLLGATPVDTDLVTWDRERMAARNRRGPGHLRGTQG